MIIAHSENTTIAKIFHPLLALIAFCTDCQLAKYVEFRKKKKKILRARIPGQVHTKPDERRRLVQLRKALGRGGEALLTIVSVLQGHLAIGHRPKIKMINSMRNLGATHVLTLLSESEGATVIGDDVRNHGLNWIWLPLESGDPPSNDRRDEIFRPLTNAALCSIEKAGFMSIAPPEFIVPGWLLTPFFVSSDCYPKMR